MPDLACRADEYRRTEADLPNRPEGIRRILTDWLVSHSYLKA